MIVYKCMKLCKITSRNTGRLSEAPILLTSLTPVLKRFAFIQGASDSQCYAGCMEHSGVSKCVIYMYVDKFSLF